eukprot:9064917-Alexandrium_andersonii.AAC.1
MDVSSDLGGSATAVTRATQIIRDIIIFRFVDEVMRSNVDVGIKVNHGTMALLSCAASRVRKPCVERQPTGSEAQERQERGAVPKPKPIEASRDARGALETAEGVFT